MTEKLPGVWNNALKMAAYGCKVIPLNGKDAFLSEWPKKGRSGAAGIKEWAKLFHEKNYGIICDDFFVLEIDLDGNDYVGEVDRLRDILGPFTPGFTVKTGREGGGYHIYCRSNGREIPKQDLTTLTQARGVGHYVVGPGSIHPNGTVYTIDPTFQGKPTDDPSKLTELSDETLDRLAKKRDVSPSTEKVFTFGDGDVLELEHPACIRRLMLRGAPNDQEYVQANHTIARYVISSGLSDADGAAIAAETAQHTVGHKTTKNEFDRVYNFRTCLNSARSNPGANQFACSFVWGSKELCGGGLCDKCPHERDDTAPTDEELDAMVRAETLRIMREGDSPGYIHSQYQKGHASDSETGWVMILGKAVQNVVNAVGIQPRGTGDSGKGKTHAKTVAIHLFPQEYVFRGSLSNKALFYHDITPMTVLFLDDMTLSEELEELARVSMTNFQEKTPYKTLEKATNKALTLWLPERMMWAFANVEDTLDEQTLNRMVGVDADESEEADEAAHILTAKRRHDGTLAYPVTFEVLVCRDIYRVLHDEIGPFTVAISFADKILWPHKENRRNFDIFCDFVCGFAALRCMQRERRDGVVFANRADFDDAAKLYRKINKTQTTKLNEKQLTIIQAINDHGKSASINELTEILASQKISYQTIRNILTGRDGKPGLLKRIPGMKHIEGGTSTTTKTGDGEATTTSDRSDIFELPWNFKMLEAYDEGSIELPEDADDIDLGTFTLKHHLNTPFTDNLYKLEIGKTSTKEETDDTLLLYTTTLHNNTHTYTDNSEHTAGVGVCVNDRDRDTHAHTSTVRVSEKSCKSVKAAENENQNDENKEEIENKVHIDEKVLLQRLVKAGYKTRTPRPLVLEALESLHVRKLGTPCVPIISLDTTHPHTDDEFCWFFELELMQFKYTDGRKRHGCTTDDDVGVVICKSICDERSIHLQDVVQAWGRLRDNAAIVSVLDEIFNRAPRGKADGPKLMES